MRETKYNQVIRNLSERLVDTQRPIRILDALKWDATIEAQFFKKGFKELPRITGPQYYEKNPLRFDPDSKIAEFNQIERDIRRKLGQYNPVGAIMQRMCREYCLVIELLQARGTSHFTRYSQQLYGSSEDAFYAGAPALKDLAMLLSSTLVTIQKQTETELDKKIYSSKETVAILEKRLSQYFQDGKSQTCVKLSDNIIADAAAGAECIKIRRDATFSERELRVLEVHEGWVHLGTTLNGMSQPICTFLSKGLPSSTITQEGLAIIMEIFTFSAHPARLQRLIDRVIAVHMAEHGANFIEVFDHFRDQGLSEKESYAHTTRIFRGSLPNHGPFTKDLVYNKGFILIYNYIRLSVQRGSLARIPLLFLGKTSLEDLHIFHDLVEEGLIIPPKHIPPPFQDLAALSSWMCYSLFLNQLDVKRLAYEYKEIL